MKNTLILASALLLFACGASKNTEIKDANEPSAVTATIGETSEEDQPANIDNVKVKGNFMTMDVTYENGCSDDQIMVVGSPMLMKSMPAIRIVTVNRVKGTSDCAAFITKKIRVDISALAEKQESGSVIMLQFPGVRDKVKYTYE